MAQFKFNARSQKEFDKLSPEVKRQIIKKLLYFSKLAEPLEFAERLVNFKIGEYRFRVGDYRVICDLEGDDLIILSVGHRRDIYR